LGIKKNTTCFKVISGSTEKYSATMPSNLPLKSQLEHYKFVRLLRTKTLLPGTFADVELPLDVIGAIVIPTQAVIPVQNGKKFLFLILEKRRKSWSKLQQEQMLPINFI
jgi:membrane fusion protein (multidrug efflux system)